MTPVCALPTNSITPSFSFQSRGFRLVIDVVFFDYGWMDGWMEYMQGTIPAFLLFCFKSIHKELSHESTLPWQELSHESTLPWQ
jgi:hypothetical protein